MVYFLATELVSREKVNSEPMVTEREKARPCLTSAWMRSRHWLARLGSTTDILVLSSESVRFEVQKHSAASVCQKGF